MPMPKRSSVDDYFAQLADHERPHLVALRELSAAVRRLLPVDRCGVVSFTDVEVSKDLKNKETKKNAPGQGRTANLRLRRATLYPIELRAQVTLMYI